MKGVLQFVKLNPILIVSVIVVIGSAVWLMMIAGEGAEFRKKMEGRGGEKAALESLSKTSVTIPPKEPDGQPETLTVAMNDLGIDALEAVYKTMDEEYVKIFKLAADYNRGSFRPLDDGLFPQPINGSKVFYARRVYREYFPRFLGEYSPDVKFEPRLNAGMPPSAEAVKAEMARIEQNFIAGETGNVGKGDLNEGKKAQLARKKRDELITILKNQAEKIHLYAATTPGDDGFPFQIDDWSDPANDERPDIETIWESQMRLWIVQAISQLIMDTNDVSNPKANVMNKPIKRLFSVQAIPGYVGVNSEGGMALMKLEDNSGGGGSGQKAEGGVVTGKSVANLGSADQRLPDDFGISPTGRRSNPIYDVRHARVHMIVDWKTFPTFLHKLNDNFMTVLSVQISDVDEYEHLQEGFIYGEGDAVEVNMLIESIWLREWTVQFMPPNVKKGLGIKAPAAGG